MKWRSEEYKTEAALAGLTARREREKNKNQATERMRGSLQCVWAQYWYWAEALELK